MSYDNEYDSFTIEHLCSCGVTSQVEMVRDNGQTFMADQYMKCECGRTIEV